ncbi:ligase-associated DNA damage response DEXH box helicase [soil metagenome]
MPRAALRPSTWFKQRGWTPFPFQRAVWKAIEAGESGLLHATTGAGKTYAVWLGALGAFGGRKPAGTAILWITPMRALAQDTGRAISEPLATLAPDWTVGVRTGDTPSAERARQDRKPPSALVTTPETLTLMLTRADARDTLASIRMIVVDEWHELLGNKRGAQLQLAMARLRAWNRELIVWGLSATLGDLEVARDALLAGGPGEIVRGAVPKKLVIDALIPPSIERFPWGGHLGIKLLEAVAKEIESASTTLVFTNVRSQAEIWYRELLAIRPEWAGLIALHHGSLDREIRDWVELGLKTGSLKAVVSTSSLDLGVDFLPVERVLQIGSAEGVARLLQRAGRSGHAPGRPSRVTLVPTHALELIEAAAARHAGLASRVESREPPRKPLDVLVQHLVSMALGGGFKPDDLYAEVVTAWSYRDLTRAEFDWTVAFVERGGAALGAYPEYHRIALDEQGVYRVPSAAIAKRHRMSIGTIVGDGTMTVAWLTGGRLGTIEERFISFLKHGDVFIFAGRTLELIRTENMTAYVRNASGRRGVVPTWAGARMSLSGELSDASLEVLADYVEHRGDPAHRFDPEIEAIRPLLELQSRWSDLPTTDRLVCEQTRTREGHHFFCYPFAGRMAHIGLGSVVAWRAARDRPGTFSISMNDYGFELLSATPFDWKALIEQGLLSSDHLLEDVLQALNSSELARRRFREIARISGLVFSGYPGAPKSARQLQASSGLFYEVFAKHDAGNLLLGQAQAEALEQELEIKRLREALSRMNRQQLAFHETERPTPFSFPLLVERLREKLTTEKLADRVQRMLVDLEKAADRR